MGPAYLCRTSDSVPDQHIMSWTQRLLFFFSRRIFHPIEPVSSPPPSKISPFDFSPPSTRIDLGSTVSTAPLPGRLQQHTTLSQHVPSSRRHTWNHRAVRPLVTHNALDLSKKKPFFSRKKPAENTVAKKGNCLLKGDRTAARNNLQPITKLDDNGGMNMRSCADAVWASASSG